MRLKYAGPINYRQPHAFVSNTELSPRQNKVRIRKNGGIALCTSITSACSTLKLLAEIQRDSVQEFSPPEHVRYRKRCMLQFQVKHIDGV